MVDMIVGRANEKKVFEAVYGSNESEFLALYGRRRIGKTYLVKQFFSQKQCCFFTMTGIQNGEAQDQLDAFTQSISRQFYQGVSLQAPENWFGAFQLLFEALENNVVEKEKIVIFLDEFPWMATHRSKLLSALEFYWNQYWSNDDRIKLIICGSSASWIIQKIINNRGGLHNRITRKMHLSPFSLHETKKFLQFRGLRLNNRQITQLYMVMGGVPYYLKAVEKGLSAAENVDQMAFSDEGLLLKEFDQLFASLFSDADTYVSLIKIIAQHRYGIGQEELARASKQHESGGRLGERLRDLEEAGFIIRFLPHWNKKKGVYYRVIDEYTLFYLRWIAPVKQSLQAKTTNEGYWASEQATPAWQCWSGYAFEAICYKHLAQIRRALAISPGAIANVWRFVPRQDSDERGTQIDLLFDRKDNAITLCEIKFCDKKLVINKSMAENWRHKQAVFVAKTRTKKQIFIALIAAGGVKNNLYADELVSKVVVLNDLFKA